MPLPHVPSVLVVDSEAATARVARDAFADWDVRFVAVPDAEAASGELMHRAFDAVVCDLPGEGFNGFEWLKSLLRSHPPSPSSV